MTDRSSLEGASPLLATTLTVRFFLELALLVGVGAVVWRLAPGGWRWSGAIIAAAVVATVWGLFLSPKARFTLPSAAASTLEAVLFLGVGAALIAVGHVVAAVVGVAVWIVHRIALAVIRH